jgi:hypothetical protein
MDCSVGFFLSIWKQSWSVSNIWSGMGHPPHKSGCGYKMVFALLSCSSLRIFLGWCCLLFLWIRCASDSSNGGLLVVLLYMSCSSLSSIRFSIVHTRVPSGLCSVVCDVFFWCWVSSYLTVGWMSRSGLIGVVENVRLTDLHPSFVIGFTWGALLLT